MQSRVGSCNSREPSTTIRDRDEGGRPADRLGCGIGAPPPTKAPLAPPSFRRTAGMPQGLGDITMGYRRPVRIPFHTIRRYSNSRNAANVLRKDGRSSTEFPVSAGSATGAEKPPSYARSFPAVRLPRSVENPETAAGVFFHGDAAAVQGGSHAHGAADAHRSSRRLDLRLLALQPAMGALSHCFLYELPRLRNIPLR